MSGRTDDRATISRIYAEAILALASARGAAHEINGEWADLLAFLDQEREVDGFLSSPVEDAKAKQGLIEKALRGRASDLFVDALQVIRRKGRLDLLREVAVAYGKALAEAEGRVEVEVVSAVALSEPLRREIGVAASQSTGRKADLVERVDPAILGGLVVRIGDTKIDASVAARLVAMRGVLESRASLELVSGREYLSES